MQVWPANHGDPPVPNFQLCATFYVVAGSLNSDPHACVALYQLSSLSSLSYFEDSLLSFTLQFKVIYTLP